MALHKPPLSDGDDQGSGTDFDLRTDSLKERNLLSALRRQEKNNSSNTAVCQTVDPKPTAPFPRITHMAPQPTHGHICFTFRSGPTEVHCDNVTNAPNSCTQEMRCTGSRKSSLGRINRQGLETAVSLVVTGEKIKKTPLDFSWHWDTHGHCE